MMQIYRVLRAQFVGILKKAGAKDAFNARVFKSFAYWQDPPQMS
jgi:hypothetical protein